MGARYQMRSVLDRIAPERLTVFLGKGHTDVWCGRWDDDNDGVHYKITLGSVALLLLLLRLVNSSRIQRHSK